MSDPELDAVLDALVKKYVSDPDGGLALPQFITVCQELGIGAPQGPIGAHVLSAVFSKARGVVSSQQQQQGGGGTVAQPPTLSPAQARKAFHEAADVAGTHLRMLFADPSVAATPLLMPAREGGSAWGRSPSGLGHTGRLVPTAISGTPSPRTSGARKSAMPSNVPPISLSQTASAAPYLPSPHYAGQRPMTATAASPTYSGDSGAAPSVSSTHDLLHYMQGMGYAGGPPASRGGSGGSTSARATTANGQSPSRRRGNMPRGSYDVGEERFERIVGRLEVANAQRAEERRKMEDRLSSADLLNLLEDFGRRIRDLESRNAESGAAMETLIRASASATDQERRLTLLEGQRLEPRVVELENGLKVVAHDGDAHWTAVAAQAAKSGVQLAEVSAKCAALEERNRQLEQAMSDQAAEMAKLNEGTRSALEASAATEAQLVALRPSFDDATNAWNASMDRAFREFESSTQAHVTELESTVVSLEAKLENHHASTTSKIDDLGGRLEALKGEVSVAVKSALMTAAAAAPAAPSAAVAPVEVASSSSDSSVAAAKLADIESELQAVHAKMSDLIMSSGSTAGAVSEALTALTQRIDANDLALEQVKASAAAVVAAEKASIAGPPPSSAVAPVANTQPGGAESFLSRLTVLEDQGATFKRFVVEAIKRTTELSTAVQEHGKAIAALQSSSHASGSPGSASASRPEDDATTAAGISGGSSSLVTVEQLSSFEFKITQTLTQMHQMHVAKILEWEEQLAAIEGQIQQLSEDQQQLWLHASGNAPPPPVVIVNAPQASAKT